MAWAALIPVAIAAFQKLTEQPPQGSTSKGAGGGYTPTALGAGGAAAGADAGAGPRMADLYKQPGAESAQSVSPTGPDQTLGALGAPSGSLSSQGINQTADALKTGSPSDSGGAGDGGGNTAGQINQYAGLAQSLAGMLGAGGQPPAGGGLMRGPSQPFQPTAMAQLQQRLAALKSNPYGGGY
jgi:hypothetical protein